MVLPGCKTVLPGCISALPGCKGVLPGCKGVLPGCKGVVPGCCKFEFAGDVDSVKASAIPANSVSIDAQHAKSLAILTASDVL